MTTLDSQRGDRDVAVILAAGGVGARLGAGLPKALRPLVGEPLLVHAARRVTAARPVGLLVVAAPPDHESVVRTLLETVTGVEVAVVTGGAERQQSVAAALALVPPEFPIVLVHDAARALTPASLFEQVAAAVRDGREAVIPVLPVVDTIARVDPAGRVVGNPDRGALRAVQTPQGFRRSVLAKAHAAATGAAATDDAGLVARLGIPVHTVPGAAAAMKITSPSDLLIAEAMLTRPGAHH
ncbi:MAG TPA: 2-C-methyl-D-erythritol 4-phosphate cytidylyltransferase [Natronosporangium sp.]